MNKLLFFIVIFFLVQISYAQTDSIDYLGQTPPSTIPERFAPAKINGYVHGKVAVSPNGDEIFWVVKPSTERILTSKLIDGTWTEPVVADFVNNYLSVYNGDPVFSPDGNRLFFYSNRSGGIGNFDVWYVEKNGSGWGDAVNVGEPYNTTEFDPTPIFTNNEKAYRFDYNNNNLCYTYSNNIFVNPEFAEASPDYAPWWSIFISPEEDYLIFAGGADNADLYIRFKNNNNHWGEAVNMGNKINTTGYWERFPVVSLDGKYLFFIRGNSSIADLYWVSAEVIDSLKAVVTDVKEDGIGINKSFKLNQNYPNPFNPSTIISYQLSESCDVKIKIYDTLGREIKTLIDSFQNTGEHSVVWNGIDNSHNPVSSGIYFYSLEAGALKLQKKMVLVQ